MPDSNNLNDAIHAIHTGLYDRAQALYRELRGTTPTNDIRIAQWRKLLGDNVNSPEVIGSMWACATTRAVVKYIAAQQLSEPGQSLVDNAQHLQDRLK